MSAAAVLADCARAIFGPAPVPAPLAAGDAGAELIARLLEPRVHAVYARALEPWPEDPTELVHDLRVATRRLREALALARPLLPAEETRAADRRAQRFGRALGPLRTADVMLTLVRSRFGEVEALTAHLERVRDRALSRARAEFPPEKLTRHGLRALALLPRPEDSGLPLSAIAPAHLAARAREAAALLPWFDRPGATEEQHRLRIRLKRLRYAVEILRQAYPAALEARAAVAPLKALQDTLGDLRDAEELLALVRARARKRGVGRASGGAETAALTEAARVLEAEVQRRFEVAHREIRTAGPALLEQLSSALVVPSAGDPTGVSRPVDRGGRTTAL